MHECLSDDIKKWTELRKEKIYILGKKYYVFSVEFKYVTLRNIS